jgi:hypothetical protein
MNDLVTQLNALITQVNLLLRENNDPDCDQQLWDLRHLLSALRDSALGKAYDQNTPVYGAAVSALNDAAGAAAAAVADIGKVQSAIDKLTAAAKAADKVVGLFARLA